MTRRLARACLTVLAALALASCSRTDVFQGPRATIAVAPASGRLETGQSLQLAATTVPANLALRWTVEPAGTGSVSGSGLYTAPESLSGASVTVTVRAEVLSAPEVGADAALLVVAVPAGPAVRLEPVSGDGQAVVAGATTVQPLVVKAVDARAHGVAGVRVSFLSAGSAAVDAVSDEGGVAQATVTAPTLAGPMLVTVAADGLDPLVFGLRVSTGPPARLAATHPAPRGRPGAVVVEPLVLLFTDQFDNPVAGQTARAEAPAGATASPLDAASGADGLQRYAIKLGRSAGLQHFGFSLVEDPSVAASLDFTTVGGPAASVVMLDGDGQEGAVAQDLGQPLRVKVLDSDGFPAGSGTLAWTSADGALFDGSGLVPDTGGIASTRVTLPSHAGLVRLTCQADGLAGSPVTFIARARAGVAQRLVLVSGGGQTTTAGTLFGGAFSVRATDAFSNGVPGVGVHFETTGGTGGVTPSDVSTGPDGLAQASLTAGVTGAQRYRASVGGLIGSPIDIAGTAVAPTLPLLALLSGQGQSALVGTDLPQALVVRVTQNGAPVAGQTVTFAVALGDGSVRPATGVTAGDGTARTTARLGSQSGAQRFSATSPGATGSPVFFDATAAARPVAFLRVVSGAAQAAPPGTALPDPLVVEALDAAGAPVPGLFVTFAGPGGAVLAPTGATTDTSGRASTQATLAPTEGDQLFSATLVSSPVAPATFHETATGVATGKRLRITGGQGQAAEVGLALPQPLEVTVTGDAGAPLAGVAVRWAAQADQATVLATFTVTDANGRAEATAQLGRPVGAQQFLATVDGAGGSPAAFTATGLTAPADRLVVASGDGQSALAGTQLPGRCVVRATDRVGNAKQGVGVSFRAVAAGASVGPRSATTDASGEASTVATLGNSAGAQTFSAEAPGLAAAVFTALATNAVDHISVAPQAVLLQVGASIRYTATAIYSDGTGSDVTADATWTAVGPPPGALTVSNQPGSKGIGLAVAAGSSTVAASYGGKLGHTAVTVNQATLASVVVLPATPTLEKGSSRAFRATGTYTNGEVVELTETASWTSSVPAVASVSDMAGTKGLVRAVGVGTSTVTATALGVTGTRLVTVAQAALSQLEVSPANIDQPAGTGFTFRATATYADGTVEDVTRVASWSSSDTALMTVQNAPAEAGKATFLAAGRPEVRASWGGVTASQPVLITAATVLALAIIPRQLDLAVRDFVQPRLIATFSDGTVSDVANLATWSSTAPTVADVSNAATSRGLITGIAPGTATVSARLGAATAALPVTVNNSSVQGIRVFAGGGRQQPRCPVGGVLILRAGALYSSGQPADISDQASWSVSSPAIAVVGQGAQFGGVVQCLAEGTATVSAEWAGKTGTLDITVTAAELTSIDVVPATAQLARGDVRSFFATGHYSDRTQRELTALATWGSSDGTVVGTSNAPQSRGRATALDPGTAKVTATYQGVSGSAAVTVTSATLTLVIVSPANPVARQRDRFVQFNATAVYSDGTTQDVTEQAAWTASNPQVALVSNDPTTIGVVILQGPGGTTVAAAYAGKQGQTTLTVR